MMLTTPSVSLIYLACGFYVIATVLFGLTVKATSTQDKKTTREIGAISMTIAGLLAHLTYFIARWVVSGYAPVRSVFEILTFFSMSLILAFIIIYFIHRLNVLGLFVVPLTLLIMALAAMFPVNILPLSAAGQNSWLPIQITTVSLAQGILGIGFVAGFMYLLKKIDQRKLTRLNLGLEVVIYFMFAFIGFVFIMIPFKVLDYQVVLEYVSGEQLRGVSYRLPALIAPQGGVVTTPRAMSALLESPTWMSTLDIRKVNAFIWSVLTGTILYLATILSLKKRVGAALQPLLKVIKLEALDEITYRSIAIGFPIFTLGALIFASIWAQIACERLWGGRPKEILTLVTWFFYAAFLHLRLFKGWRGEKTAWLAVLGFVLIVFNVMMIDLINTDLYAYL